MNNPVNFEVANLLKSKKVYPIDFGNYYQEDGDISYCNLGSLTSSFCRNLKYKECFAPTIAEACMYFYDKYNIWICIDKAEDFDCFKFNIRKLRDIGYEYGGFGSDYKSPTEAYQAAIEYSLNNLI